LYNTGQIKHITDTTWNRKQFYSVTRNRRHGSHVWPRICRARLATWKELDPELRALTAGAIKPLGTGGQVFAGQRADGFYVDLGSVFDLGDLRPFQPTSFSRPSSHAGITPLPA